MPGKSTAAAADRTARLGTEQPGQQPQQRRFARAVRPSQQQGAARIDPGRNGVEQQSPATPASQIVDYERIHHIYGLMARPAFVTPGEWVTGGNFLAITLAMSPAADRPSLSTTARMAINFGPLLLFFGASKLGKSLFENGRITGLADAEVASAVIGTAVFVLATLVAALWHWTKTRHLPAAMVFTTVIVVLFGGLTIWLQDKAFIQLKPSIIYGVFALLLFGGLATGRPTLQLVMGDALPGLSPAGLRLLTRNWAMFFVALLAANEVARRLLGYDDWLSFKVWGVTVAIFVFTMAQAPLLSRHGLKLD